MLKSDYIILTLELLQKFRNLASSKFRYTEDKTKFLNIEDKTPYDLTLLNSLLSWNLILPTDVLNIHHT